MLNGQLDKIPASVQMSVQNEPIIPVQVKYVNAQSAKILQNPKAILRISKTQEQESESLLNNNLCQSPTSPEQLAHTSFTPPMSPTAGHPVNTAASNKFQFDPNLSYAEKVAHEMIITEKIYLDNLKQIIDGFLDPVSNHPNLDVSQKNIDDLFINVEEIYNFNWILLKNMEECNYDPVKLAECFVVKQTGFDVYTRYCTQYPRSMEVLMEWNQREDTASFIKKQQDTLGHTLPLCSFLLKPVQRILKYHLLLGNIAKHFKQSEDEEGFQVIQKALSTMTNVAKHINNMKRKHEDAVRLQEIQSVLVEYEGPNLTTFGSLVLEDTFRLHGTKTDRFLFLFKKALLITKRRSDGTFTWKATVMHSNMMLADSVFREPLTFQVFPFDDRKTFYTFVARNMDTKQTWLLELKRRLLDSYTAAVPMKAKQIILGNSRDEYEKENAEPESDCKLLSNNTRKGANQQRTQPAKDDGIQSNKSNKVTENDRRKGKEFEENTEEKSRGSMDSIKNPLRRKLRVFKKRKFSKDQGKSSKTVSWSSDDNNEEPFVPNKPPGLNDDLKKDNVTISNTQIPPTRRTTKSDYILPMDIQNEDIEEDVSVESLSHVGGKATMSVSGEVNNSSEHLKLRWTIPRAGLPIKKRRLAKENREKSKSMPVGGFLSDEGEIRFHSRSQSMSQLYEQFTEEEMFSNLVSAKQLQNKYGLVNLRENASTIRTRRLGSFEEQMASIEGCLLVDSEANNFTDDAMSKIADDTKVIQTMKCVSAAFSDISPNFSPEKSPASSTEELTEDLTALDDDSDDFGMFEEEQATYGDIDDPPPLTEQEMENRTDSKPECNSRQNDEEDDTVWDQIAGDSASPASNEDVALYSNEQHSNDDKSSTLLSGRSSYADTLSDFCDDQDEDTQSLTNSVKGTYKKVFSLKRAYSEENLVSKCSLNETESNHSPAFAITSKSCTNFEQKHFPIMRSKSIGSSSSYRSPNSRPFKFSVTPKKKIVIKDSLWETIKEDPENHERSTLIKDGLAVQRRRKQRTSQKSNKDRLRVDSTAQPQQKLYTYVSLHIADYRKANGEPKVVDHAPDILLISESQQKYKNGVETAMPQAPRDMQLGLRQEITGKSVTKVDVALKRKSNKPTREKSVVLRVDGNVSEAPQNINYLCVEKFPTDEHVTSDELQNQVLEDSAKLNGASKVEKLSKYFSEFKPADIKSKSKSSKALRNANNVKKLIEELKGKEHGNEGAPVMIPKERSIGREELNVQRINYRIDELQRVTQVEKQSSSDTKSELDNTVIHNAHNVERLKNRIEENSFSDGPCQDYEVELGNQLQSRLCIKDRVDEIEHQDVNENTGNSKSRGKVDEELRTCQHIKDRIERLQKGNEKEVDHGKDITISDENEMTQCLMSPRQNEELKTVVIKRGWVQQFVQKIETGS